MQATAWIVASYSEWASFLQKDEFYGAASSIVKRVFFIQTLSFSNQVYPAVKQMCQLIIRAEFLT